MDLEELPSREAVAAPRKPKRSCRKPKKRASARRSPYAGNCLQGSNWIRRAKRLRIYARDHWRCVWCCDPVADGRALVSKPLDRRALATLDHFLTRGRGGSNAASNLLTCCSACNAKRDDKSALEWAHERARGEPALIAHILERALRALEAPLPELERSAA